MKLKKRLRALQEHFAVKKMKDDPIEVVTEYVSVGKRDSDDVLGPPPPCASGSVDPDGERIHRKPGENVEAFTTRLCALAGRKEKSSREVFLFGPENPPAA